MVYYNICGEYDTENMCHAGDKFREKGMRRDLDRLELKLERRM